MSGFMMRSVRDELFKEQDGRCHYCGARMHNRQGSNESLNRATGDHIVPASKGGANTKDNIVCACYRCNTARGNIPYAEFVEIRKRRDWVQVCKRVQNTIARKCKFRHQDLQHQTVKKLKMNHRFVYI